MHIDELSEGDYRTYAGALEAPIRDGYVAAVVISRLRGVRSAPREGVPGHQHERGSSAGLCERGSRHALSTARKMIRTQPNRLAC